MSGDAEDFELNPLIRPGEVVNSGFQSPAANYPKVEYINQPSVNLRARGIVVDDRDTVGVRSARVSSLVPQFKAPLIAEPPVGANPRYPHNHVVETEGGHTIEYDDTPGFERINIKHKTGSQLEIKPNGTVLLKSRDKLYTLVASDAQLVVRGQVNITVQSNADIRVQGDANMQVDGDFNQLVQGNYNVEINGNKNERVHGNESSRIAGSSLREMRGNVLRRHLSNYRERTVGDHDTEIGGSWGTTVEGTINERSYGEFQGSYFGGFVTLNGQDKDGNDGAGLFEAAVIYNDTFHGDDGYWTATIHAGGDILSASTMHAGLEVRAPTMHATTFEGTAVRSNWASTAGSAPTGASSPTSPSPQSPTAPTDPEEAPDSTETVVDVTGTSDLFIEDLDRSHITGHNIRRLNTAEVVSRARNKKLRTNSEWLQDQIDNGAITTSIASSSPPRARREANGVSSYVQSDGSIGQINRDEGTYALPDRNTLPITTIPEHMRLTTGIAKTSALSPRFKLSHMLGADYLASSLKAQLGLSAAQIATNTQLIAYNILEPLRNKYKDTWAISEGVYNLLPNEKVDSSSLTVDFAKGTGVGIQFIVQPNSHYFDAAMWIRANIVFDKLVLSYIDYDPSGVNEPTLIVTVKPGTNAKQVWTEFNHVKVADELMDLSND